MAACVCVVDFILTVRKFKTFPVRGGDRAWRYRFCCRFFSLCVVVVVVVVGVGVSNTQSQAGQEWRVTLEEAYQFDASLTLNPLKPDRRTDVEKDLQVIGEEIGLFFFLPSLFLVANAIYNKLIYNFFRGFP